MYIDSHAHLDGPRFDSDRDQVIARAAGVSTILAIGIGEGPGTLDCAIKLAAQHDFGLESNGMIVAASLGDGKPVLAGFLEEVPVGARLK